MGGHSQIRSRLVITLGVLNQIAWPKTLKLWKPSYFVTPGRCCNWDFLKDKWQWYRPTLARSSCATLPCTLFEFDCLTLLMLANRFIPVNFKQKMGIYNQIRVISSMIPSRSITNIQLEVHGTKKTVSLWHLVVMSFWVIMWALQTFERKPIN